MVVVCVIELRRNYLKSFGFLGFSSMAFGLFYSLANTEKPCQCIKSSHYR